MLRRLIFKLSKKEDTDKRIPTRFVYEQALEYGFSLIFIIIKKGKYLLVEEQKL